MRDDYNEKFKTIREKIVEEVSNGATRMETAAKLGCNYSHVCKTLNKAGIVFKCNLTTIETVTVMAQLVNSDKSLSVIAEELNHSISSVSYIYNLAKNAGFNLIERKRGRQKGAKV